MENVGIKETKELLGFGFSLQKTIAGAMSDGVINWKDLRYLVGLIKPAAQGLGGINKIKAEILDLDDQEKAELMDFARQEFDLDNDNLEHLIEDTLDQLLDLIKLSLRFSGNRK